jgi:rod shape-determining protein MreC
MKLDEVQQRIRWFTIAILASVAILLSLLDSAGNLDDAFDFIRNPLASVLGWTAARTDTLADALSGPRDLQVAQEDITRLNERLADLERQNEELREIQGEYQLLLDLFNRARQSPEFRRLTASVIGRDTSLSIRSIIIDKGTEEGVIVGMPVEGARGLVGRVFRTTAQSAQVVLITDNASSVAARLGNSRATGILRGGGVGGSMSIDWVDLKHQLEIGEVVLTSGLAGKFPQDLVIGRVSEVERREAELFQRAIVQPAVDFDALEIVFVITNFQPIDTEVFTDSSGN